MVVPGARRVCPRGCIGPLQRLAALTVLVLSMGFARPAAASDAPPPSNAGAGTSGEAAGSAEQKEYEVLVRPFTQILYAQVDLEEADGGESFEFVPNPTTNVGLKLGAWGFAVSGSLGVGQLEPVSEYGKSSNFNVELSYPFEVLGGRELNVAAFLHYHRHLSVTRPGTGRRLIEGAYITTLGLDATLMLNPDFSVDAALGDFTRREGSAGSWFLRSSLGSWFLGFLEEPERVLVPDDLDEGVGELAALNQLNSLSMTVSGGYVYDWNIFGHVFMSALGNIGLAFSALELAFVSAPRERTPAYGPSVAAQLGLSYVGESFHVGVTSNATVDNGSASGIDVYTQRISSMLFMGMRF